MKTLEKSIHVVPLKITWPNPVREVVFFSDRLELVSERIETIYFYSIAEMKPSLWERLLNLVFKKPLEPVYVGERAWTKVAGLGPRYFKFFTKPELCLWLPLEDATVSYTDSDFAKIQHLLLQNAYATWDLT